jgi:hypothetical protein
MIEDWIQEYIEGSDTESQLKGKQMLKDYSFIKERFNKGANHIYCNFARIIA